MEEMTMVAYLSPLIGGALIGLSAAMLLLLNGRIAGVSGIVASLFRGGSVPMANLAFVAGLTLGPTAYRLWTGEWPLVQPQGPLLLFAVAGLLVGFGTRMGSGCTSGHGVAGLARLSARSIAAVLVFLAAAVTTVALMRWGGLP